MINRTQVIHKQGCTNLSIHSDCRCLKESFRLMWIYIRVYVPLVLFSDVAYASAAANFASSLSIVACINMPTASVN
jgi:hypothetical protein